MTTILPHGTRTVYSHTLTQQDIDDFARLSGDDHPNHVDPEFMASTPYGKTIAHGVLVMAFMAGASRKALQENRLAVSLSGTTIVSSGYDRVRFARAAFPGDVLSVHWEVEEFPAPDRLVADVRIVNQDDQVIAVAKHLMRIVGD